MTSVLEAMLRSLRTLPDTLVVLSTVDSTQAMALRLVEQLAQEDQCLGTAVIVARTQTRGAGRDGRVWVSPPGGLYLTWVGCDLPGTVLDRIPVLAAAAALRALDAFGVRAGLKWPNDLVLDGAKAGGLLVTVRRSRLAWCAVGLGVNVTALPELPAGDTTPVTRLADHAGGAPGPEAIPGLAAAFVEHLHGALRDPESARALWEERLVHRHGDRLTVRTGPEAVLEGRYLGVTPRGHLRLEVDGSERVLASGIVEYEPGVFRPRAGGW